MKNVAPKFTLTEKIGGKESKFFFGFLSASPKVCVTRRNQIEKKKKETEFRKPQRNLREID